jgi:Tfp pilus assembly protein PilO
MNRNYIGAGLIAIAIIIFWALIFPFYNEVSDLDSAIRDREDLLKSRDTIINNTKELSKEYQKRIPEIAKLSAIVPSKKSVAEVLSAIDVLSLKNGMQLSSSAIISPNNSDSTAGLYNLLSVEIGLSGSYPALVSFLQALEKNLRLIDITSIDAAAGLGNTSTLNFVVKGNAYYLK